MDDSALDVRRPVGLTLRVADLTAALAFWSETLGIPIKLRGDGFAELQTDTLLVTLVERADGPEVTLGWEVRSLEAAAAQLGGRGIDARAASDRAPGRRLAFADPDGHALEIVDPRG